MSFDKNLIVLFASRSCDKMLLYSFNFPNLITITAQLGAKRNFDCADVGTPRASQCMQQYFVQFSSSHYWLGIYTDRLYLSK